MSHTPISRSISRSALSLLCAAAPLAFLACQRSTSDELSAGAPAHVAGAQTSAAPSTGPAVTAVAASGKVTHTDAEWRELLTPEQYRVCREKGTERPNTGEYTDTEDKGVYRCVACGQELFRSDTKFHSGTGWPSYWQPIPNAIELSGDSSLGMDRTEVTCSRCGAHLGHVFDDGPQPTGKRYCINSVALKFVKQP